MKTLRVVLGLLVLVPGLALAQDSAGTYYIEYFANNAGLRGPDAGAKIINVGKLGSPITSPVGDICLNFYVFDANQEMSECCARRLTPNELFQGSITRGTSNPVNGVVPSSGVVKIVFVPATTAGCNPTAFVGTPDASLAAVSKPNLQVVGGVTFVTETTLPQLTLSAVEAESLQDTCFFVLELGSGKGNCNVVPTN